MNSNAPGRLHSLRLDAEVKAELLETTCWADQFGFAELKSLSMPMQVYRAEAGDLIVEEGELESFLCLVIRGAVEIFKVDLGRSAQDHRADRIGEDLWRNGAD